MDKLPNELLIIILDKLCDNKSFFTFIRASKKYNNICQLYKREFAIQWYKKYKINVVDNLTYNELDDLFVRLSYRFEQIPNLSNNILSTKINVITNFHFDNIVIVKNNIRNIPKYDIVPVAKNADIHIKVARIEDNTYTIVPKNNCYIDIDDRNKIITLISLRNGNLDYCAMFLK